MKQKQLFLVGLIVVFLVLACGTASPEATQVAGDSPQVEPAATATPTVAAAPDISANFVTFENEVFSLDHPGDWFTDALGGLGFFATDEGLQGTWFDDQGLPNVAEGALLIVTAGVRGDMGIGAGDSALAAFEGTIDLSNPNCSVMEAPRETTINGQDAATARFTCTTSTGIVTTAVSTMVLDGDKAAVLSGVVAAQSEAEYLPILEAMIESFRFTH